MDKLPENIAVKKRSSTDWKKFEQKLKIFLTATKKTQETDDIKIAILLATGGDLVLDEYNATFKDNEKPKFEDVLGKLRTVFAGNESEHYLAHVFRERTQRHGEAISEWITDLRLKVKVCNYDTQQDRMIRDQIIYGVACKETRRELLKVAKLSTDDAVKICLAMESSSKQLESFRQTASRPAENERALEREEELNVIRGGGQRKPPMRRPFQNNSYRSEQNSNNVRSRATMSRATSGEMRSCKKCGRKHANRECWAMGKRCLRCGEMDHLAAVCTAPQPKVFSVREEADLEDGYEEDVQWVCAVQNSKETKGKMAFVAMEVREADSRKPIRLQIDCGASCNVISSAMVPKAKIEGRRRPMIRGYTGDRMRSVGTTQLNVKNCKTGKTSQLEFVVIEQERQPILGKMSAEAMGYIRFDYEQIDTIVNQQEIQTAEEMRKQYPTLFDGELGKFPGKVKLHLREGAIPACNVSSRVSPHLREKLKRTLNRMAARSVIEKVDEPTEWVSRLSIQTKKSGELRLCLDPRHLNEHLIREVYHTTELDEILPDLSEAKIFSKFDLADGFWHCELEKESSRLTTFQTPFGRYCFKRLPFGLNVSTEIFYKRLIQLLEGLQGTFALADDVLICGRGRNHEEAVKDHDKNLHDFLERCRQKGIKLNWNKVTLRASNTKFFGFELTERGIQMDMERQKAIMSMRQPSDVIALKSFLGMLSHVARFIPKLSEVVAPLRELCRNGVAWGWKQEHRKSFKRAVALVGASVPLAFFDPKEEIEIECDASKHSLGAALVQKNKPVYFASRTMSKTETRYAQIEKELLAVAYALKRFHYFICPRKVTVYTDHRPLTSIINKAMEDVPLRLQKMLMSIQRYNVELVFRPGKDMKFADALSRCPIEDNSERREEEEEVRVIRTLPIRDATLEKVQSEATKDKQYQELLRQTREGWPESKIKVPLALREFFPYRHRLTVEHGLILKDNSVVVPKAMRKNILKSLCWAHMSVQRTIERAKSCVFWPRMNSDIENHISECVGCQTYPNPPRKEPMQPHEIPCRPWQKIAMDVAEQEGRKYLVLICFYSNLIMVSELPGNPTTKSITTRLAAVFSEHGSCDVLMSDADPLFRASSFKEFTDEWAVKHKWSSAHYHQSNGKAEAAVAIVKRMIKRAQAAGDDWRKGLLAYNDTPQHKLGGATPGEMFFSRRMRTELPMARAKLRPTTVHHTRAMSARRAAIIRMKRSYDKGANKLPSLQVGDTVRIRPTKLGSSRWMQGQVTATLENRSYRVKSDGREITRNRRHLVLVKARNAEVNTEVDKRSDVQVQTGIKVPAWLWRAEEEEEEDTEEAPTQANEMENSTGSEFEDAEESLEEREISQEEESEDDIREPESPRSNGVNEEKRNLRDRRTIKPPDRYGH